MIQWIHHPINGPRSLSSLQLLILFLTVFIDFVINNSLVIMTCFIFFFPLHSWVLLWQFLIWGIFNSHFLPILGDFMRYLVRILIDFIINGSLVILTWLYSSFLYLSFCVLVASGNTQSEAFLTLIFFPFWVISRGT